ncbi:ArsR/SmtB family transcription factor [Paenibacillus pinihumi]|uniref:ArsR/SmtB family transcription factor n=1 Tax=Paenibacillus pinihumi TaxID=669462 RepID=UPI000ABFCB60|nr:metalloregulator ArsR/SmtB family transcription factor [Paenibacillus pinihumi]
MKCTRFIIKHMVKYNDELLNDVFHVLSDPTRREIIRRLADGEKTVMSLAEPFEMSLPAISKHLKVLETAGVVSKRKEGTFRYYNVNPDIVDSAKEWLMDLSKFWPEQLNNLEQFLNQNSKDR